MRSVFRRADERELGAVWRFYEQVCAAQSDSQYGPGWHIGVYPAPDDIEEHTRRGELMLYCVDDRIAAAAVLTERDDPMYAAVRWPTEAAPEEVGAVHLLAVHPDHRGRGLAGELVDALIRRARENGKKCLRLDVILGNLPAERLYLSRGFRFVEERTVFYEDTGETVVRLFELLL